MCARRVTLRLVGAKPYVREAPRDCGCEGFSYVNMLCVFTLPSVCGHIIEFGFFRVCGGFLEARGFVLWGVFIYTHYITLYIYIVLCISL